MAFVFLAVALGAVAQAVAGFGFALVCGPILIAALGPGEGVRVIIALSAIINIALLLREIRDVRLGDSAFLLIPAIAMTPLFAWLLRRLDMRVVTVTAGALTIISAAIVARGLRLPWLRGPRGAAGAGVVSAAMNVVGGLSGPAVALYAVNADWPAASVRPTLQVYGLGLNIVALAALGIPALTPYPLLGLLAGWAAGSVAAGRLSACGTRRVILALAFVGGCLAIWRGLR